MKIIKLISILLFVSVFNIFGAYSLPQRDNEYVNDYSNILSEVELEQIRADVQAMCDYYSTQIAVCIVSTFDGYNIDDYAAKLGKEWGVTDEKGLLILVKPKTKSEKGEALVLTSPDLTDVFTSKVCKDIVSECMIPYFKQNDYYSGIEAALVYLNKMTDESADEHGNSTPVLAMQNHPSNDSSTEEKETDYMLELNFLLIILVIILVWVLVKRKRNNDNEKHYRRRKTEEDEEIDKELKEDPEIIQKKKELAKQRKKVAALEKLKREEEKLRDEEIDKELEEDPEIIQKEKELAKQRKRVAALEKLKREEENLRARELRAQKIDDVSSEYSIEDDYHVSSHEYIDENETRYASQSNLISAKEEQYGESAEDVRDIVGQVMSSSSRKKSKVGKILAGAAVLAGGAYAVKKIKDKKKQEQDEEKQEISENGMEDVIEQISDLFPSKLFRGGRGNSSSGSW